MHATIGLNGNVPNFEFQPWLLRGLIDNCEVVTKRPAIVQRPGILRAVLSLEQQVNRSILIHRCR